MSDRLRRLLFELKIDLLILGLCILFCELCRVHKDAHSSGADPCDTRPAYPTQAGAGSSN
jgi:hypothetical protein